MLIDGRHQAGCQTFQFTIRSPGLNFLQQTMRFTMVGGTALRQVTLVKIRARQSVQFFDLSALAGSRLGRQRYAFCLRNSFQLLLRFRMIVDHLLRKIFNFRRFRLALRQFSGLDFRDIGSGQFAHHLAIRIAHRLAAARRGCAARSTRL